MASSPPFPFQQRTSSLHFNLAVHKAATSLLSSFNIPPAQLHLLKHLVPLFLFLFLSLHREADHGRTLHSSQIDHRHILPHAHHQIKSQTEIPPPLFNTLSSILLHIAVHFPGKPKVVFSWEACLVFPFCANHKKASTRTGVIGQSICWIGHIWLYVYIVKCPFVVTLNWFCYTSRWLARGNF